MEGAAQSFVNRVVAASLAQPLLTGILAIVLIGVGAWSFSRLPVDAYPDVSPPMVEIISQWPGHAAEEVERLITVPVEAGMNGTPNLKVMRSVSLYGLSDVTMTFEDRTDTYFARQQVFERIPDLSLPAGVSSSVAPMSSPSGLVYRYVVQSPDRTPMQLKNIQDWILEKQYKAVPGVADMSSLGGQTMQYQVLVDPTKLAGAGLNVSTLANALGNNNGNAGGGFYSEGGQFYYVRGLGRINTLEDIANTVVAVQNGTPVLVKDVGSVEIGYAPRLGQFGFNDQNDAVEGVILIFFLYDIRSGLIVAVSIPLALMFAFICLDLKGIPANLLSIGAIDFGILVDGAVVMVENIHRQLARRHGTAYDIKAVITDAAAEVDRPIVYAIAVIIAGFSPIYVLTGPSGRLFKPMADTTIFALIGSLLVTITLLPVVCAVVLRGGVKERRNATFEWILLQYRRGLEWSLQHAKIVLWGSIAIGVACLLLITRIGGEFMPKLDEGALWVRATMPYTISFEESSKIVPQIRAIIKSFPEVTLVASEHGRPDDGTDATGFFNAEFYVGLKPYGEWHGKYRTKAELIAAIDKKLRVYPGITFNYTQPAEDAVDEAETGLKSSLDAKIFGTDLKVLQERGTEIKKVLDQVRGITQVTLVQELGQPALTVTADRAKMARYGLNVSDVNGLIEAAVGGSAATQVVQGEQLYDLVVRLQPQFRETADEIGNILIATPSGAQIPLREVTTLKIDNGASFIYRQDNSRYIGLQYSVTGRDLAGAVDDARAQVERKVKLPPGYSIVWGGEFEEYTASRRQLQIVLPLTLAVIFILLFALYRNFKFPFITVVGVLLSAPLGGLVALWISGTPFSVSSGIGFLALFGVSVQTAVVYISYANELRLGGLGISEATLDAALLRLRPIMMTALVAALGLLPAALSTGVGSDTQKPFALVIVGGLFSRLLISVFLMPVLYAMFAREGDHLEV